MFERDEVIATTEHSQGDKMLTTLRQWRSAEGIDDNAKACDSCV